MPEVTQLVLSVDSRQVKSASGDLGKLASAGKSAEKEANALARAYQSVGRVFGAVAASVLAREVIQAADAYKSMNARLQLVSKSASEFATAQEAIFKISQRTRSGLVETSDLYASLSRSTQSLGVSQADLLKVTESINQAMVISGTSAADAQGALVQLGQAFASGTLRGDELNSILERTPRLAQAMAEGLGIPQGKLRELGAAGELTAEKIFRALQKSSGTLQKEFEKLPTLVEQSVNSIGKSLSRLIGMVDEAAGATSKLAQTLTLVSKGIDALGDMPKLAKLAGLASDLTEANEFLNRLKAAKESPWAPLIPDLDAQLADAQRKFEEARLKFKVADGRLGVPTAGDQSTAEGRRLGLLPPTPVPEGGKKPKATRTGSVVNEAAQYLESLMRQLDATEKLSTEQQLLRDLELGRLDKVTPAQRAALVETAKKIDLEKELNTVIEEFAKLDADAQERSNRLRAEGAAVYESTRTPVERLSAETARLDKLLKDGAISWDTYSRAMLDSLENFDRVSAGANTTGKEIDQVAKNALENIQRSLGDELTNMLDGDFKNIGDSFTKMLKRMVAEAAAADIVKAMGLGSGKSGTSGLIEGLIGLFGGATPNAKGGIYNSPGLSAYSGSIVNRPTLFPFARGAGLMGEAGPEAILPLSRGKDGKLGVAGGGGTNITVKLINESGMAMQATSQRQTTAPDGSQILEVVMSAVGDALANRSGPVARGLEGGYGIRPSMG